MYVRGSFARRRTTTLFAIVFERVHPFNFARASHSEPSPTPASYTPLRSMRPISTVSTAFPARRLARWRAAPMRLSSSFLRYGRREDTRETKSLATNNVRASRTRSRDVPSEELQIIRPRAVSLSLRASRLIDETKKGDPGFQALIEPLKSQ